MFSRSLCLVGFSFVGLLGFLCFSAAGSQPQSTICPFRSIYQFGDSIADTGNLILNGPVGARSHAARFPYGETFFRRPTGRCSNGQLMIDFFARALQLPLLKPYLGNDKSFRNGVNFAVAGSTALNSSFFTARGLHVPATNTPLGKQLSWFNSHLRSVCRSNCSERLRRSLFMVGEIGGNDYNYGFFQGKSVDEVRAFIPHVVQTIAAAVREVIRHGAVRVVVPGNFPIGCFPIYLSSFPANDPRAYDDKGCLRHMNEFAVEHNNALQAAIASLRQEFPHAVIVYGDYYAAFQSVLGRASTLGFDERAALRSCCGVGGAYNYDGSRQCGASGVPVCPNPDRYISWDGVHLTQKAYRHMSEFLVYNILSQIQCVW
ncbi:PREDICTED: GDSL esterase/lipase At5g03980 [Tarenaya hassleriana]|uniref:GDSL esterase/lipase At5g03980 n=1 Tax=Tarenaya hassleriana TaxID=28532 RepID=UPI00053C4884|nr:PREDICTED: GDSL esterase/lipase At5g03980 [Tarenaya hassleriana]